MKNLIGGVVTLIIANTIVNYWYELGKQRGKAEAYKEMLEEKTEE